MRSKDPVRRIAILGGGPSALFMVKRLVESGHHDLLVDIYEKSGNLGCGMPYGHDGSADEHVTNVSGNEIPELPADMADWVEKVPKDTLDKYHLDPGRFNDYKVLPRLLFGQYLCDQFKVLLQQAKDSGLKTQVYYNTTVLDIVDQPDQQQVAVLTNKGSDIYDHVIVCTGHIWPKKHEGRVPGWFDSPYPPEKIALKADHPVAVRGASLTAIDAIKTLARHNGRFEKDEKGRLHFYPESPGFKIVMHSRNGLLPAVRFHLEDSHLGKDTVLSPEKIAANREANEGYLSLDYVFEENFKKGIREHDQACYQEIKDLNMEAFVDHMMAKREAQDPFNLLKDEYAEAERSIKTRTSVYWKEMLAILSFAMNYPAKYFSAEDYLRLHQTLMPLISVVIAFVPQSSAETLMAMHEAGCLEMKVVEYDEEPEPNEQGGADYAGVHYNIFIDCIGQPHIPFEDIPFEGLKAAGTHARLGFRNKPGEYLTVPGLAINDRFQLLDPYGALNERIYIMAVPFIGGYNPDYSGLDFSEAASKLVLDGLLNKAMSA